LYSVSNICENIESEGCIICIFIGFASSFAHTALGNTYTPSLFS
jgi:hypothetical protein